MSMQFHVDFKEVIAKNVVDDGNNNDKHNDLENDDDGDDEQMVKKGWWQHQISTVPEKKPFKYTTSLFLYTALIEHLTIWLYLS